ncbi:hypothetical protein RI129_000253 [Pyrocoelia pectoralis]|uniref:DNA mismatch repair proteins mutS family domain-containing protein n=1 Tax=Pyrocoelia pectoralis TaxID=417401 RepID=A0AAN7VR25_9COLE
MNLKESLPFRARNKGRSCSVKVVPVQVPLGPPQKRAPKRKSTPSHSSNASRVKWENTITLWEGIGDAMRDVGIAAINMECPSLILCQIFDSQSYVNTLTKINILNPSEILIPITFVESCTINRLVEQLKKQFSHIKITGVNPQSFNKHTGLQYIKQLCVSNMNSVLLLIQHKYYALAAAGALLTYAERTLYIMYAKESVKVEYQESESEGCAIIDVGTAHKLELVASARPSIQKKYSCLFDILNYTYTRAGALALRATILQPPCKVHDIEARLNCVTELVEHGEMLTALKVTLKKLKSVDQLLSLVIVSPDQTQDDSERQLNYLLLLNSVLTKIPRLKEVFKNSEQPFFIEVRNMLNDPTFSVIKQLIRTMINTDAHPGKGKYGSIQHCFAIKYGISPLLDLKRNLYSEKLDELMDYVKGLAEKYSLLLTLHNNSKKGYHIVLSLNSYQQQNLKKSDLPHEFILAKRLSRSYILLKTVHLIYLSHRIEDINLEILILSNIMINKILIEVRKYAGLFYTLCENLAKVDMIQSLAQASTAMQYVRPNFSNYLEILDGRHPLLNFLLPVEPVANSIFASEDHNMHIITGPNGSGKSILIRQIVLLQIMAQAGCYVPAKSATFRVADRILARISFDDNNMPCGVSTFVLEMKEIQYFLTAMSKNSLVIADELCRSTSLEGTALAMAICERLKETPAFVFCTTHFKLMSKLYDLYMNVKVWQLETLTEIISDQVVLKFTYNLIPNPTSVEHKASCPQNTIRKYAEGIQQHLSSQTSSSINLSHFERRLCQMNITAEAEEHALQCTLPKEAELQDENKGRCLQSAPSKGDGDIILLTVDRKHTVNSKSQICTDEEIEEMIAELESYSEDFFDADPWTNKTLSQCHTAEAQSQSSSINLSHFERRLCQMNITAEAEEHALQCTLPKDAELQNENKGRCLQSAPSKGDGDTILLTVDRKHTVNSKSQICTDEEIEEMITELESYSEDFFDADPWANKTLSQCHTAEAQSQSSSINPSHFERRLCQMNIAAEERALQCALPKEAELQNENKGKCLQSAPNKGNGDAILLTVDRNHTVNSKSQIGTDEETEKIIAELESYSEDFFDADPWADETQASGTSVSSHFGYGGFQKTVTAEVHHTQHSPYLEKNIINTTSIGADNTKKQSVATPQCNLPEVLTIKHRSEITQKLSQHGKDTNNMINEDSCIFLQETQLLITHCSQNAEPIASSKSTLAKDISINNSIAIPSEVNTTLEPLGDIHLELFSDSSQEQENSIYKTPQSSPDLFSTQPSPKRVNESKDEKNSETSKHDEAASFPIPTSRKKMKWNPPYKTKSTISTVSKNKRNLEQLTTPISQPKNEIQQCFYEQDKELLSRNDHGPPLAEYIIINRPKVKQVQGVDHIVTVQHTNEGVIVQPFSRDKKTHSKKKFVTPLLGKPSPKFDIQMFSDKNASRFEELVNSKKKASPSNRRQESASFAFSVCGSAHRNDEATKTDEDMRNVGIQDFKSPL